jgi:ADP-ribose pyrophosphatase YjhB (NUDIX family)
MPNIQTLIQKRLRPGVKALIVHQGKILMIHENVLRNGSKVEITDFPGGGIEFGETLHEALIREVQEEIGLQIKVEKVVGAWDFVLGEKDHEMPDKTGVHIVCIGYQCSIIGEPTIDTTKNPAQEDIFDAKWYTREELLAKQDTLLGVDGMIRAVENLEI